MRYMNLASACLAALVAAAPASAQITGTLGGGYTRVTDAGGADIYGVNGSFAAPIGGGFSF